MIQPRARCLIVQLARLGDTVQSLMAIRAAKQLYPDVDFYMVVRKKFSSAAKASPWLAGVIELPTEKILGAILHNPNSKTGQAESMRELAHWISPLAAYRWDFIFNWTFSESSSYLTALLPARVKLGFSRQKDITLSALDGWSQYIQGIVQGNIPQNIHLTDILTTQLLTAFQIHLGDPGSAEAGQVFIKNFFQTEESRSYDFVPQMRFPIVGIQLGASRLEKTWSAENWATWMSMILKRHPEIRFVLLGGKEDLRLEDELYEELKKQTQDIPSVIMDRVYCAVGRADFDAWVSLISRCQWLASADTAAVHIASVLGIRVLNLSVGPVRLEETGPYGNGHVVIRSDIPCEACHSKGRQDVDHSCRDDVSPEAVYAAWHYHHFAMGRHSLEEHFQGLGFADEIASVQVFRSRVRSAEEGGGVAYDPICVRPLTLESWFSQVMGFVARSWYCGWVPPVGSELQRESISPELLRGLRELNESCDVFYKICMQTQRVASELRTKSAALKSDRIMRLEAKQELQSLGKKLIELETLMDRVARNQPLLKAFSQVSRVLMHNLEGDRLADLGKQTMEAYRQIATGVAIVQDWARKTLGLVRPEVVQPVEVTREINQNLD